MNEEALTKFEAILNKACYDDMYGDYVMLSLDTETKFPESAVDLHCSMQNDLNCYCRLFNKCVGRFTYFDQPSIITQEHDECELAKFLNEDFFSCRIMDMFVPF